MALSIPGGHTLNQSIPWRNDSRSELTWLKFNKIVCSQGGIDVHKLLTEFPEALQLERHVRASLSQPPKRGREYYDSILLADVLILVDTYVKEA